MWGAAVTGALGLFASGSIRASLGNPLAFGFIALIAAVLLQLVPLSPIAMRVVSPSTARFVETYVELPVNLAQPAAIGTNDARLPSASRPLSVDPRSTVQGVLFIAALGLLVVGGMAALTPRDVRLLGGGVLVIGLSVALVAIVQRAYGGPPLGFWAPRFGGGANAVGPFINRNHFAGWMVMASSVGLGYLMALTSRQFRSGQPNWRSRILALSSHEASQVLLVGLVLSVMALSVLLSLSRSGIGCGALVVLGMVLVRAKRRRSRSGLSLAAAVLAVLILGTAGWASVVTVSGRFAAMQDPGVGGRAALWRDAIEVVRRFPLTGTGLSTYTAVTPFFQADASSPSADEAHNDYLQLAAEGGLLVGIPALCLAVLFVREVRRRFHTETSSTSYWMRAGAVSGLVAIAVQELVEFSLQIPGNAVLFAVLCAIALHRSDQQGLREALER